jgi:hypothetical protein
MSDGSVVGTSETIQCEVPPVIGVEKDVLVRNAGDNPKSPFE